MSSSVSTPNGFVVVTHVYPQKSGSAVPAPYAMPKVSSLLGKFLKGEPKVLGTIQIIIGVTVLLFGIVMAVCADKITVFSGIDFWGALIYITSGALTVAAEKRLNKCLVNGALGMNIISTIIAGFAIFLHSMDLVINMNYYNCNTYDCDHIAYMYTIRSHGISGVLLLFCILEFIISICVSAFACKAVCDSTSEQVGFMQNPQAEVNNVISGHLPIPKINTYETLNYNPVKISNLTEPY